MTGEIALYIVFAISVYNFFGAFVTSAWGDYVQTDNRFDLFNPRFAYETYRVNWFGAIMISLLYTLLFPLGAIMYWFWQLCTVGRE